MSSNGDRSRALALALWPPNKKHIISEVHPRIFIADAVTAHRPSTLSTRAGGTGITHLVCVLEGTCPAIAGEEDGARQLRLHLEDSASADLLVHLPRAVKFIQDALQDPAARVLVHCWHGMSRSPSIVAAYLIATEHISADAAVTRLKARRRFVKPNAGFLSQLRQFEATLAKDLDTDSVLPIQPQES